MSDKLPCCGNDKVILVDISDHFERKIECSKCATQFYQNKTTGELTKIGKFGKKKNAPDMSDKRPWTPGPWRNRVIMTIDDPGPKRDVNYRLASKAPEMAELLIEQVKDSYGIPIGRLERMVNLLRECGYDPGKQEYEVDNV